MLTDLKISDFLEQTASGTPVPGGGSVSALSAALGAWHHPAWLLFTGFVGLNLFQSGFTDWCPMVWILQKAGLKRCHCAGE